MGNDSLQQVFVTRIPRRESNQRKFGMRGGVGGTRTAHAFEPQVFHDNQGVFDFTFASDWSRRCMRVL